MTGEEPGDNREGESQASQEPEEGSSENAQTETNGEDATERPTNWINDASLEELVEYDVDKEALQTVRRESREVLTERIRLLRDLDDKAMRTVRTSVLFIGLVISAIQVSDGSFSSVSTSSPSFQIGVGGVTFLLISIILGVYTYSASEPDFGVSDGHRSDVVEGEFSEKEWLLFQLGEYNEWIRNMREMTEKNVVGLHLTLFTATTGVVALLLSVVYSAGWNYKPLLVPALIAVIFSIIVGATLYGTAGSD